MRPVRLLLDGQMQSALPIRLIMAPAASVVAWTFAGNP